MIDARLRHESFLLGKLSVCHILLKNDTRFPWILLVPDVPHIVDFDELSQAQQHQACDDITLTSLAIKALWPVDKINIATLGNIVPQCHIHVVGRRVDDILWPQPIWGAGESTPYELVDIPPLLNRICAQLNLPLLTQFPSSD